MVFKKSISKVKNPRLGCGFTAVVGLTSIFLLIFNGMVLDSLLGDNISPEDMRIVGPIQFVGSVVMIFFEYWIFDRIAARFGKR